MEGLTVYVVADANSDCDVFVFGVFTERWRADLLAAQERARVVETVLHVGDGRIGGDAA